MEDPSEAQLVAERLAAERLRADAAEDLRSHQACLDLRLPCPGDAEVEFPQEFEVPNLSFRFKLEGVSDWTLSPSDDAMRWRMQSVPTVTQLTRKNYGAA